MPRRRSSSLALLVLTSSLAWSPASADNPWSGVTIISPLTRNDTYIIDMNGAIVETWHGAAKPATFARLLDDGSILRPCEDPNGHYLAGGFGGRIQRIDASDHVAWDYLFSDSIHQQHHDALMMPGGTVLLLAWEGKTADEAVAAGWAGTPQGLWPTMIAEVRPEGAGGGEVVWQWHLWDHLVQDFDSTRENFGVIAEHPELLDINCSYIPPPGLDDWDHANSIDYDAGSDEIVFASRSFGEIYVIDHGTTTAQAASHAGGRRGHGGDILYRWGNPRNYGRGAAGDQVLFAPHCANWIVPGDPGQGDILIYNNGDRPGGTNDYTTVVEITPPRDGAGDFVLDSGAPFGPSDPTWVYGGPGGFYGGPTYGGAYRLPNGNTLITDYLTGQAWEVTAAGATVWQFALPLGKLTRALRYPAIRTGVPFVRAGSAGPGGPVLRARPNPFGGAVELEFELAGSGGVKLGVYDMTGRRVALPAAGTLGAGEHVARWNGRDDAGRAVSPGVYIVRLEAEGAITETRVVYLGR